MRASRVADSLHVKSPAEAGPLLTNDFCLQDSMICF